MADVLDEHMIHAALAKRPHWESRENALVRVVQAPDFLRGVQLVGEVAQVAEELNHHPDIDIRYTAVTFRLSTHSAGGVTQNDVDLAGRIDDIADRVL
ncbi:MAG: 4a-hydroxytetrahydrobiopterin dehydratase [Nocardioidaceae bacterium]